MFTCNLYLIAHDHTQLPSPLITTISHGPNDLLLYLHGNGLLFTAQNGLNKDSQAVTSHTVDPSIAGLSWDLRYYAGSRETCKLSSGQSN